MTRELDNAIAHRPAIWDERVPDSDACVVALVDHPRVKPSTVAALIEAYGEQRAELVRPCHRGLRGHPYLSGRP